MDPYFYYRPQNWWMRPIIDEPLFPPLVTGHGRRHYNIWENNCPLRRSRSETNTRCPTFARGSGNVPAIKYKAHHTTNFTRNIDGVEVSEKTESIEHENGEKEEKCVRTVGDKKVTTEKKTDKNGKETESTKYENCNEQNFMIEWNGKQ